MPPKKRGHGWQQRPSRRASEDGDDVGTELQRMITSMTTLSSSKHVFKMTDPDDRVRLIRRMWMPGDAFDITSTESSLLGANLGLVHLVVHATWNTYKERLGLAAVLQSEAAQMELLLANLIRMQSIHQVTLLTALFSVAAYRAGLPEHLWSIIRPLSPGLLSSHKWVEDLITQALRYRPPPPYECLPGVAGAVFDNYQRNALYFSTKTSDEDGGWSIKMTNWAVLKIPRHLAPPSFDAARLGGRAHALAAMPGCFGSQAAAYDFPPPRANISRRSALSVCSVLSPGVHRAIRSRQC